MYSVDKAGSACMGIEYSSFSAPARSYLILANQNQTSQSACPHYKSRLYSLTPAFVLAYIKTHRPAPTQSTS